MMKRTNGHVYPEGLRSQSGSSLTEFVVCVPVLLFLFAVCGELNDRVLNKQRLRIATRNAAYMAHVDQDGGKGLAKDFALASDPNDGHVARDEERRATLVIEDASAHVNADAAPYGKRLRLAFSEKLDSAETASGGRVFHAVSDAEGAVAGNLVPLVDKVKNAAFAGQKLLIEDALTHVRVEWRVLRPGLGERTVNAIGDLIARSVPGAKAIPDDGIAQASGFYVRKGAGNHPDPYRYETLVGYFLGGNGKIAAWHAPAKRGVDGGQDSFMGACAMHFMADSNCARSGNWFSHTMRIALVVRTVAQWVADFFSAGQAAEASVAARGAVEGLSSAVSASLVKKVEESVTNQASEGIKRLGDAGDLAKGLGVPDVMRAFGDYRNALNQPDVSGSVATGVLKP